MALVVVLVKRNRCEQKTQHSFKCVGGVLDTTAVRGRGYYIRRVNGQNERVVLNHLHSIVKAREVKETIDV